MTKTITCNNNNIFDVIHKWGLKMIKYTYLILFFVEWGDCFSFDPQLKKKSFFRIG